MLQAIRKPDIEAFNCPASDTRCSTDWLLAYNVDTKKLARILSLAAGAESTGLQVVENLKGHAYIMSNNQHQGDWIKSTPADLKEKLEKRAGELYGMNRHGVNNFRLGAHVGYVGGLPGF